MSPLLLNMIEHKDAYEVAAIWWQLMAASSKAGEQQQKLVTPAPEKGHAASKSRNIVGCLVQKKKEKGQVN